MPTKLYMKSKKHLSKEGKRWHSLIKTSKEFLLHTFSVLHYKLTDQQL